MKSKLFSFFLALIASVGTLWASDISVDGIWYNFDDNTMTAGVTYQGSSFSAYADEYSGSVVIPASVTYSGKTYSVTNIGFKAFSGCSSLTSVTIPNSVIWIDDYAFAGCSGLTSITFGANLTEIGWSVLADCASLKSVTWNAKNMSDFSSSDNTPFYCNLNYGYKSVDLRQQITSFELGDSVEHIPAYLCSGLNLLTSITIPNSVTSIGTDAFKGCSTSVVWNAKNCINSGGFGSQVESFVFGNEVESIPASCCSGMSKLTAINIPNSVTSIGDAAFNYCTGLLSLTIGDNVSEIGQKAFYRCSNLVSVDIPNNVISIGDDAFKDVFNIVYSGSATGSPWGAKNMNCFPDGWFVYRDSSRADLLRCSTGAKGQIVLSDSVKTIGDRAFSGCNSLTSVTIPNSVTNIGDGAFSYCSSLTSITIPNSVTSIGNYAFQNCSSLTSVTIPNSVTSIGYSAFQECTGLTSITIPNSVTSIGVFTFSGCSGLTSITIPNSVTSIGDYAFYGCKIATINYMGTIAEWCEKSWTPGQISGNYILSINGIEQTSVTIPNNVTSIEANAFSGCRNLRNVLLGSSVKVLEEKAFFSCPSLETITCYSMRPPTVNNAFDNLPYSTIVYVPADYMNTYKMHDFWGLYDVRPLGATSVQITDLQITPDDNTAEVVWPTVENAATYEMIIKDKNGVIVCTLIFNANGQLMQIAFNAPARDNAAQASGFSFTVTGLEGGTSYDLTISAKDAQGKVLQTQTQSFTTAGAASGIHQTNATATPQKVLRDGKVLILRDGKTFTIQGQEVK